MGAKRVARNRLTPEKRFKHLFSILFSCVPMKSGVALSQSNAEKSSLPPKLGCSFVPLQFTIVCPHYGGERVYSFITLVI